ncbi:transmembrane protein 25 [Heteronotia binoei]|uniref:transmembrane protein 25 n=1 Tax=Heteronotia binoei TaxID=13085 RepID=UPI002931E7FE|nr:transmembrane protein 25 [Heteronotia binoei]
MALLLLLLLALLLPALLPPGAAEPEEAEGRAAFSCLAAAPSLAWYLDGESNSSSAPGATPRRLHRRLNCSALDPASGRLAPVLLHVHFKPELVQVEARAAEGGPQRPGLLLVLLVLVRASPPASITWVDPDGRRMVNTSHFLIVDAKTYPWLAGHTLEVQLRGWARNLSSPDDDPAGLGLNASLLLPGFLDTHVELPLLALVIGAAVALALFVGLGTLVSFVGYQKGKVASGLALPAQQPPRDSSSHAKPQGPPRLPRANMSLPSNLQLNDFPPEPPSKAATVPAEGAEDEEAALSEPENSLALANRGLSRFPMVGYIYRASSGSSEEIWL